MPLLSYFFGSPAGCSMVSNLTKIGRLYQLELTVSYILAQSLKWGNTLLLYHFKSFKIRLTFYTKLKSQISIKNSCLVQLSSSILELCRIESNIPATWMTKDDFQKQNKNGREEWDREREVQLTVKTPPIMAQIFVMKCGKDLEFSVIKTWLHEEAWLSTYQKKGTKSKH